MDFGKFWNDNRNGCFFLNYRCNIPYHRSLLLQIDLTVVIVDLRVLRPLLYLIPLLLLLLLLLGSFALA